MSKKLLIAVVAIILAGGVKLSADDSQKREFRAAWLATVWRIDWPSTAGTSTSVANSQKSQLVAYLDDFQSQNFNAVCFHVRSMCDAMYESSYEPWSSYLTGSRGAKPAWDPLAYAVEQAHARGLELHAWVNPYRWATTSSGWSTAQDQALVNAGLILSYTASDGTVTQILNPGLPAARERIVNVVREIITKYDVDGIIFDDYFYPNGIPTSSSAGDYNLWQAYRSNGGTLSFANWRREQVNQMVRDVYNMIAETKPEVRFGIGPAGVAGTSSTSASKYGVTPCPKGSDWQYNGIFSDPLGWLYDGAIDYISPQLYWKTTHSTNPFGPLTQWWSYCANHFGRHHFASHSISFLASSSGAENNANGWAEVAQQIRLSRQYNLDNAPGVNIYSAKNINGRNGGVSGLGAYLKENVFQTKAIVPAITWKNGAAYAAPTNARLSNGKLMWNAVNGTLIKYSVYAVPLSVTIADAQSSTFGGIKSDYLLNLTYTNSFTLPSDKQSGYWYAVCVVDGYDKEYDPAYVNVITEEADEVSLISPINGATVNWSQQFNWSAANDATYCLQIASDANFGNIVIEKANLTTNSATVSLSTLDEATTYYWRIVTSQPERLDKPSASATFCTKTRPLAAKTTLVSPDDGAEVEDDFTLVCTKASGVTHYKVQVSAESTFETIKYESSDVVANGSRMNFNLNTALLGKGTFYWRVITSATNCNDNTSDMRSFIITKLSTGAYEPGYVIKKDIDTYSTVDGLKFTSLWMRSIKSEYDNMTFEEDGRMNRGFVVMGDKIYVSGRYSASSSSGTYLQVYSTETGEHLHDIVLGNDASVPYYPCNDVFTDGYGHVLISNLATDAYNQSIFIHMVDTETGNLTEIAEVSLTSTSYGKRIDHCAVYGDVTTGNFCVFAALASGTAIMRWTYRDGSLASSKLTNCSSFYPNGSSFGIAPHIWPLSETMVYVDGGATDFTKYNISSTNGVIDDSFANNVAIAPVDHKGNGGAMFTFKDKNYFVYPYSDETSNEGYRFMLVDNATGTNYSGFGSLQLFPTRGIGNVDSQTWVADCQTVVEGHSYADIFVYVPGNGMAAYRLEPDVKVMMGDVNGDGHINIADVTVLIQKVLGYHPIDFVPANSDLDGDGVYSINDVTLLIIKILE